jgi:hypothetical protein
MTDSIHRKCAVTSGTEVFVTAGFSAILKVDAVEAEHD